MNPNIVGLGGSLRASSASLLALGTALHAAGEDGAHVELLDLRELDLPLYGTTGRAVPGGAERLARAVGEADAMIWSSPLYHGTVSASFKNALDWLELLGAADPPYLSGMPVGLIAAAGGSQGLQAINTMEFVVRALRGWTVPFVVAVPRAYAAFGPDGRPREEAVGGQLATLGREVVAAARRFTRRPPAQPERSGPARSMST